MYQAQFGLTKPLFENGIAQDAAVFLTPKHELIIANTKVAFTTFDSAIVLTGPAGVGKTTLMSAALRTTSTRLALGWITSVPANAAELLELLLVELGFNAHRVGRVERMQMWRQFLNEMSATSSRVYIIAERAEDLAPEVLRALDSLTAADANGSLGANLVLLGQTSLAEHLKSPVLESLRQRIRLRQRLEPLDMDELQGYFDHHVKLAGGESAELFAPGAVRVLHAFSGGIPRVANNLCETALTLAASEKQSALTPELVTRVAVGLFGMEPIEPPATAASRVPKTAASAPTPAAVQPAPHAPAATVVPLAPTVAPPPAATAASPPAAAVVQSFAATAIPLPAAVFVAPSAAAFVAPPAATLVTPPAATVVPAPADGASDSAAADVAAARFSDAPRLTDTARAVDTDRASEAARSANTVESHEVASALDIASAADVASAAEVSARVAAAPRVSAPDPDSRADAQSLWRETLPADVDSFADTLTDSPDVPMMDLPVLTDAVDPPQPLRARAETAYVKQTPQPTVTRPAQSTTARSMPPTARSPVPPATQPNARAPAAPAAQPSAAAPAESPASPRAAAPATPAAQKVAKPAPAEALAAPPPPSEDQDELRQTQTMRALAAAKSIDDISNSMAETLFGEADLDMLSAALASAGWSEDADSTPSAAAPAAAPAAAQTPATPPTAAPAAAQPAAARPAAPAAARPTAPAAARPAAPAAARPATPAAARPTAPAAARPTAPAAAPAARAPQSTAAEEDPFDFLGLGHDAPLELIEDSSPTDYMKIAGGS